MKKIVWIVSGCVVLLITMGIVIKMSNNEQRISNSGRRSKGISNNEQGMMKAGGERGTKEITNRPKVESEKSAQSVDELSAELSSAVQTSVCHTFKLYQDSVFNRRSV